MKVWAASAELHCKKDYYNLLDNLFLEAKGNSIPKSLCSPYYNVA